MEFTGSFKNVSRDFESEKYQVTFTVNEKAALRELDNIKDCEKLNIKATKYRKKRSLDANGLLWLCLGRIAEALNTDKWFIYLQMLKRYGQFTHVYLKEEVVEEVKRQWRECEVVGRKVINEGEDDEETVIDMLCYFGSSTYNTREFSKLLEGVISEMKEMGLDTPPSQEMRRALEEWEKRNEKCNSKG